jgi:hypothetical protein
MVEEAKKVLTGIDLGTLKKDENIKTYVQAQVAAIAENMKPLTMGRAWVDEPEDEDNGDNGEAAA